VALPALRPDQRHPSRHPKDLPPKSTVYDYSICGPMMARWFASIMRARCREQEQREASPTAVIIDSQRVKSVEKGGPASIRTATMRARTSRARNGIFSSIN
jgi:hypothetical protein